jgi:hypothetical protein
MDYIEIIQELTELAEIAVKNKDKKLLKEVWVEANKQHDKMVLISRTSGVEPIEDGLEWLIAIVPEDMLIELIG